MVTLKWALHKYVVIFFKLFPMFNKGPNRAHVGGDHFWLAVFIMLFPIVAFGNMLRTLWEHWKPIKTFKRTTWEPFGNVMRIQNWNLGIKEPTRVQTGNDLNLYWEDTKKHNKHVMLCFLVSITHPKCA